MATEATAPPRTLEEVVRDVLEGIERSELHFRRLAAKVDQRTGEGKRAKDKLIRAAQDYNLQGQGLRMALVTWEQQQSGPNPAPPEPKIKFAPDPA